MRGWGGHGGLSSAKESSDCGKDAALIDSLTALITCVAFAPQFFCAGVIVGLKYQERMRK